MTVCRGPNCVGTTAGNDDAVRGEGRIRSPATACAFGESARSGTAVAANAGLAGP